ncbi:hypothetical protein TTHERM_00261820 (macronuclear) [Tetrahymena thermophila SB210]|uniref:Transmembrane protein n=1 Tax=Tetrahymena thermophila (strain SB210) TaxID=312017 RepID=Q22UA2_TETTS|nr:hypothetical protein TTHERM_00261820 [Tetrahymena thermophila SB210]EAR88785.1 hypothetical protein TTHERM_00261820 [Tetrahymena thermophila SB210]|eukprot:XP_001009030.1 hypothetical protein TTHERM_00261820 [Tetrahymena thermophila SB210]
MNKIVLILLILSQISIFTYAGPTSTTENKNSTANAVCNSHPIFSKASQLLNDILNSDQKGQQINNAIQKAFQNAKPAIKTSSSLGVCSGYAQQKTCCDANYVKLVDQAALLKVKPILQAKSAFQKLINIYVSQLSRNCTQNVLPSVPLTAKAIFENTTLKVLQANRTTQANCKIKFAKAISSYTRGALCAACVGVDQASNYFNSQNQLKISKLSVAAFQSQTDSAITCFQSMFTPQNLDLILSELNAAYIKGNDTCGLNVTQSVKTKFLNPKLTNSDGYGSKMCNGTNVFTKSVGCENILQGDPLLEQNITRILQLDEQNNNNRILQLTSDAVLDNSGLEVFISSTTDDAITEDGNNITPNFTGISVTTTQSGIIFLSFILLMLNIL